MTKKNKVLLIILTIFLIIIFVPYGGKLYEVIIGHKISSGFWGLSHPEYFEGFFISYMFFVTLIITFFGRIRKYKILSILLGILLFIDLFLGAWEGLIIDLGAVLAGWLLAQGGLLVYKKLKNS